MLRFVTGSRDHAFLVRLALGHDGCRCGRLAIIAATTHKNRRQYYGEQTCNNRYVPFIYHCSVILAYSELKRKAQSRPDIYLRSFRRKTSVARKTAPPIYRISYPKVQIRGAKVSS